MRLACFNCFSTFCFAYVCSGYCFKLFDMVVFLFVFGLFPMIFGLFPICMGSNFHMSGFKSLYPLTPIPYGYYPLTPIHYGGPYGYNSCRGSSVVPMALSQFKIRFLPHQPSSWRAQLHHFFNLAPLYPPPHRSHHHILYHRAPHRG